MFDTVSSAGCLPHCDLRARARRIDRRALVDARAVPHQPRDRYLSRESARSAPGPANTTSARVSKAKAMSAPTLYSCGVVKDIDDKDVDLSSFKGKIVCVVNVATE